MNVLIVDDTEANRELLAWLLEDDGHHVIEADNGQTGVEAFIAHQPDLVLLDIMMPVMDGYDAAKAIKQQSGNRHVPIIFLTAVTDENALAKGLEFGGDDFITKPFNEGILKAKINAHTRIRELSDLISKKNKELILYHDIMENEHQIAEHVFQSALKKNQLSFPHIDHYIAPASTFNGDLLLAAPGPSGSMFYLMADFTGHGLPAAIGAIPVTQRFFELAEWGSSVGNMARNINQALLDLLPDTMFCAATLIEQKYDGTEFVVWAGGLPDAYIISSFGDIANRVRSKHMPLGILEDNEFETDLQIFNVEEGAKLVIYTDGLIEAFNDQGEMFGEEGLLQTLSAGPFSIESIINEKNNFIGEIKAEDDITIIAITAMPLPEIENEDALTIQQHYFPLKICSYFDAQTLRQTSPVDDLIEMMSNHRGLNEHRDYLHTILTELFNNALEHGLLNLNSSLKDTEEGYFRYYQEREQRLAVLQDAHLQIDIELVSQDNTKLILTVINSGDGFNYENIPVPDEDASYGRGLPLIESLSEAILFSDSGRKVEVFYPLHSH